MTYDELRRQNMLYGVGIATFSLTSAFSLKENQSPENTVLYVVVWRQGSSFLQPFNLGMNSSSCRAGELHSTALSFHLNLGGNAHRQRCCQGKRHRQEWNQLFNSDCWYKSILRWNEQQLTSDCDFSNYFAFANSVAGHTFVAPSILRSGQVDLQIAFTGLSSGRQNTIQFGPLVGQGRSTMGQALQPDHLSDPHSHVIRHRSGIRRSCKVRKRKETLKKF